MKKFEIKNKVINKKYGIGFINNINLNEPYFRYDVWFKDGTKVWLNERNIKLVKS
jgi:hypothetical protein